MRILEESPKPPRFLAESPTLQRIAADDVAEYLSEHFGADVARGHVLAAMTRLGFAFSFDTNAIMAAAYLEERKDQA